MVRPEESFAKMHKRLSLNAKQTVLLNKKRFELQQWSMPKSHVGGAQTQTRSLESSQERLSIVSSKPPLVRQDDLDRVSQNKSTLKRPSRLVVFQSSKDARVSQLDSSLMV